MSWVCPQASWRALRTGREKRARIKAGRGCRQNEPRSAGLDEILQRLESIYRASPFGSDARLYAQGWEDSASPQDGSPRLVRGRLGPFSGRGVPPSCLASPRMRVRNGLPEADAAVSCGARLHLPQLGDAADFHPLDHEDVALVIEARAVRRYELARREVVAR
jgi:hypothetical protein